MVAEKRICHSLSTMKEVSIPARNIAELLHDLGVVLHWRLRRAVGTRRALLLLQSLRWDSRLALRFVKLNVSLQLQAMVEDWPLQRIQETVQAKRLEALRP